MMDPHTAAELDLRQIRALMDDLLAAHGDWIPPGPARGPPHDRHAARFPPALARFADLEASVFITGGGSGIGAALTEGFLRQGAKVAFVQRSDARLRGRDGRLDRQPPAFPALRHHRHRRAAGRHRRRGRGARPGRVLVNNAANDKRHKTEEVTEDFWDWSHGDQPQGLFLRLSGGHPGMRAAGGGAVVNFSSISYMMGNSGYPAYTTANGGITAMTRSLAREFGPDASASTLSPGLGADREAAREMGHARGLAAHLDRAVPEGRIWPDDIVGGTLFLASARSRDDRPGLVVDGGVVVTG
jgi:NAD(P)-dependent dehydrogenase (short-subunit alcohol dehydrogenase family)